MLSKVNKNIQHIVINDTMKIFNDFKNKQKKVCKVLFFDV